MFKHLENLDYEIKISLEDEGLTFDQATKIACLTHQQQIPLNVKIGGAEAISDMRFAENIRCKGCVAPMIESSYSLHKFISSVYKNSFSFKNLFVNIESKQAYYNIKDILNSSDANHLYGIVLGRTDFIQSFGYTKSSVDSDECFDMAVEIFTLAKKKGLKKVMGGNLNVNSYSFIKKLYNKDLLDYIETRNVKVKLSNEFLNNFKENLSNMLEFESEWLTCKYNSLIQISKDDKKRLDSIKLRNK
tara:strand:- start:2064 stop:2801 length:738 start_codon:yes stop_codon:yes gene_type:complete